MLDFKTDTAEELLSGLDDRIPCEGADECGGVARWRGVHVPKSGVACTGGLFLCDQCVVKWNAEIVRYDREAPAAQQYFVCSTCHLPIGPGTLRTVPIA